MLRPHAEKLRDAAAEPMLKRVREDRRKAPPRLKPLLRYIEKHLLEPGFEVQKMRRACGVRDNSIGSVFKAALGDAPQDYVEDCRLVIAVELLIGGDLKVWEVAEAVGYSSYKTLGNALERWCGLHPTDLQRSARRVREVPREMLRGEFLRKVQRGLLTREEAQQFLAGMAALYPRRRPTRQGADQLERPLAEYIRQAVAALKQGKDHRSVVIRSAALSLFELLLRQSREEGRGGQSQRRHGLELARQAVEVLRVFEDLLGEELLEQRVLGWANLGNALRLANQLDDAEDAFTTARETWDQIRLKKPELEAELSVHEAALWIARRAYEHALALLGRTIQLTRGGSPSVVLAEALILRSTVFQNTACYQRGIEDLQEAVELLQGQRHPYLLVAAHCNLATAHGLAGDFATAKELLPKAQALCEAFEYRLALYQLQWTEGLIRRGEGDLRTAVELLAKALEGIRNLGEMGYAAVTAVDVAIGYWLQGRPGDVLDVLSEVLPTFQALRLESDALAAVVLAVKAGQVPLELLRQLRSFLGQEFQLPEIPDRRTQKIAVSR